jgi:hypothetical protein
MPHLEEENESYTQTQMDVVSISEEKHRRSLALCLTQVVELWKVGPVGGNRSVWGGVSLRVIS